MLDIISHNPYRLLGLYSNSPARERVANHNRLKAFLKVGKAVTFPLDSLEQLPPAVRTAETVAEADASLALPGEQLRHAQFWFMKATPLDEVAMNQLMAGHAPAAVEIWKKRDYASSLQNRTVCALMEEDYVTALACACKLYTSHAGEFTRLVVGDSLPADADVLAHGFLDTLSAAVGAQRLLPCLPSDEWRAYLSGQAVKPLLDALQAAVDKAKASKGKGISARYDAGVELMNGTKATLAQLRELLPADDMQYQMMADKLAQEILQCGIDYYNASEAVDAARKAMRLQKYALSVAVGKMAKDRCRENVNILQKIIDNLPPVSVFAEDRAIKEALRKFCQLPDRITHSVTLLNGAKPHLQSIKGKLGSTNAYYLKVSTQVVGNALHNVIEEVNDAQREDDDPDSIVFESTRALRAIEKLSVLRGVLQAAWNATKIMDTFDMDSSFKSRYDKNRDILKGLCDQLEISTSSVQAMSRPLARPSTPPPPPPFTPTSPKTTQKKKEIPGCIWVLIIWIGLGFLIGCIALACDGDFGVGFCISGVIILMISGILKD